jgi:hypothetical protein
LIDLKVTSKFGTISEAECLKIIDTFLNQTIKDGFVEVKRNMFAKEFESMQ